jgi:hypothetical protein
MLIIDASIINIISSISTIIATVFAWRTVIEMIKQRKTTYMPELILEKYASSNEDKEKDEEYVSIFNHNVLFNKVAFSGINFLKLYNIGLGAAKEIKMSWNIKIDDILEYIQQNDLENKYKIQIKNNYEYLFINNFIPYDISKLVIYEPHYLLPINVENTPSYIQVPIWYLILMLIAIDIIYNKDNLENDINLKSFISKLRIEYKDIANRKTLIKEYILKPRISDFLFDDYVDENYLIHAYFEILK